ncbi:MAG: adenylate kinase family protein [Desulfurobacteriaceae bacterium]
MRIGITGTPGVGKTTLGKILAKRLNLPLYNLSKLIREEGLYSSYDKERDAYEVEPEKLRKFFEGKESFIAEGLVAHYIPVDYLVILRAEPEVVKERLKERPYSQRKVEENVEAERLAVIATEAFENPNFKRVIHIDTTNRSPEEVAEIVERTISKGEELFEEVDWLE